MKTDLRVVKTKAAIEKAFIDLVEEKGYENVKLIDIAQRANVNRNTIYLHYESKEGIIESIILSAYQDQVEKLQIQSYMKMRNNRRNIASMFEAIFNTIDEKVELYRIILTSENLSGYVEKLMFNIRKYIKEICKDTIKNELTINYMIFGIYGLIRNWIIYATGTKEENIQLATDLSILALRQLQLK